MKNGSERVWKTANKIYEKILTVIFIIAILIGIYITLDVIYIYQNTGESVKRFKPDDINAETLREISGDTVGWITLDDTGIDYPIMQSKNNIDYLNKDPKGKYSLSGSIFMDYRCDSNFNDAYSLVYGHHMAGGMLFGALDPYQDESYAKTHMTGTLYTMDGEYPVKVLAYYFTKTDCDEIFNPDDNIKRVDYLRGAGNYYFRQNETENFLALTTCKDPGTTDRTALLLAIVR